MRGVMRKAKYVPPPPRKYSRPLCQGGQHEPALPDEILVNLPLDGGPAYRVHAHPVGLRPSQNLRGGSGRGRSARLVGGGARGHACGGAGSRGGRRGCVWGRTTSARVGGGRSWVHSMMRQSLLTSHELNSETAICSADRVSSPRRSWKKAWAENWPRG